MPGFADDARKVFWWVGPAAKAFGFWKPLIAIFGSLGLGLWAMVDHLPWSVIAAVLFTTFVSAVYLLFIPALVRQLAASGREAVDTPTPDLSMYRHHEAFSLRQAACLLAEMTPATPYPGEDARNWAAALFAALKAKKITRIQTASDDGDHTFPYAGGYEPHRGTMISRDQFLRFCNLHNKKPSFLTD